MNVILDVNSHQPVKSWPSVRKWKAPRSSMEGIQEGIHRTSVQTPHEGEMSFQQSPIAASHPIVPSEPHTPPRRPRGRPPGSGKKREERNEGDALSQPRSQPGSQAASQLASQTPSQPPSQPSAPRGRGRPRGSKDSVPRKPAARSPRTGVSTEPQSSAGPLRPSGLRNAVTSSDGFAVVIDSRSSATTQKQDKKGNRVESKRAKSIRHKVYKCRWNECPYELHNLQTLRKHVHKHREQYGEQGPFPCCWADCGTINLSKEEGDMDEDELIPLEFNTASAWETHIDDKHLNILAWSMGDGPTASSSGTFRIWSFIFKY